MVPDPSRIKAFRTASAFETWMTRHHDRETELWMRVYKKASGVPSITTAEALDVCLCWGWIDGIRKSLDEQSFLQRYTPRRSKSGWSQVNRDHVARLTAAGRMTPHGQRQVDAAKADGRWEAAHIPMRTVTVASLPTDLVAAIEASPRARKRLPTLGRPSLFSLMMQVAGMKTTAGRARKIEALVRALERGDAIGVGTPAAGEGVRRPRSRTSGE